MRNVFSIMLFFFMSVFFNSYHVKGQQYVTSINIEKLYGSAYEKTLVESYRAKENTADLLPYFLSAEGQLSDTQIQAYEKEFNNYCSEMQVLQQKYSSDTRFLFKLFRDVHKKYLKTFAQYEPLSKVFSDGVYNCASATSLYAMILERLGYDYQIKLTPVHCYLLVHGKDRDILLETTDKQSGFVIGQTTIQEKQDLYRADAQKALKEAYVPGYFTNLIVEVSLANMCGMQYYNSAVKLYNTRQLEDALFALSKAHVFYPSNRVEALMEVCLDDMTKHQVFSKKQQEMQKLVKLYISMARD